MCGICQPDKDKYSLCTSLTEGRRGSQNNMTSKCRQGHAAGKTLQKSLT